MKIYTYAAYIWDGTKYVLDKSESFDYTGEVELCCGASAQQQAIGASQQNFYTQLQSQATQTFGAASSVFNNLMATFQPIVAAGPSQQGFSPAELSNLNSEAITQTGQAYKNAKEAVGESQAAQGGGNTSLPSGTQTGQDLQLAESGANQTASELGQITQANYATGRQNYENAVQGELAAPGVYATSTGASGAANQGGADAATTANQISQANNSWMGLVGSALGAVGSFATGGLSGILGGVGGAASGGGSSGGASAEQETGGALY